jgi:hypothetical protein
VCRLDGGGIVLKAAAVTTEEMYQLLRSLLSPLTTVIGTEPYAR